MRGATVVAGVQRATTDSAGTFTLTDVVKTARVSVAAKYYRSLSAATTPQLGILRLAPIPVTGRLVSDLDLHMLRGMVLENKLTVPTDSNGRFTLYDIGPGNSITASAAGYQQTQGIVSANDVVTVLMMSTTASATAFDLPNIEKFWTDASVPDGPGGPAGFRGLIAFIDAHNYPGAFRQGYEQDCELHPNAIPAGGRLAWVLDPATVTRDDDYLNGLAGATGLDPNGRTYQIMLRFRASYPLSDPKPWPAAVTVRNGIVYSDFACVGPPSDSSG